ncbi:MAG TPA: hypothetical protein VIW78_13465, partial [Burkholderiales bacterium]
MRPAPQTQGKPELAEPDSMGPRSRLPPPSCPALQVRPFLGQDLRMRDLCSARSIALAVAFLAVLLDSPVRAAEKAPADLVLVRQGALPIILTAPHGGREAIPGIEPRNVEDKAHAEAWRKWGGAIAEGDPNTDTLAQGIAAEIEKLTGKAPYLVVAKFQRKYI